MRVELLPDESLEELRGGLQIIQNKKLYRFSEDSVLLSDFVDIEPGSRVIDLGTGSGVILLLLASREPNLKGVGVEIQTSLVDMARRSVCFNNLEHKIKIIQEDIKKLPASFKKQKWDLIVSNPPYIPLERGRKSPKEEIAVSRQEVLCSLGEVVFSAAELLPSGGSFALVYPAKRLTEAVFHLKNNKLEPLKMQLVSTKQNSQPYLVLIQAYKNAAPGLQVLPQKCLSPETRS